MRGASEREDSGEIVKRREEVEDSERDERLRERREEEKERGGKRVEKREWRRLKRIELPLAYAYKKI